MGKRRENRGVWHVSSIASSLFFLLLACACKVTEENGAEFSAHTARITISFTVVGSVAVRSQGTSKALLSEIESIYVYIKGPLMNSLEFTFPFEGSSTVTKTYLVPIGQDRRFYIEARAADGTALYKGEKIQNVYSGSNSIAIDMYTTEEYAKLIIHIDIPNVPESYAPVFGACVSFYGSDGDPNQGTQVSEERIRNWLAKMKPYFTAIRTYSCQNGMEKVGPIAKSMGFTVYIQAWIGGDKSANEAEMQAAIEVAEAGGCDALIAGSEVLLRGDLPAGDENSIAGDDTLIGFMKKLKDAVSVPVTYNDIGSELIENPAVVNECEGVIFANLYPYWEGVAIEGALVKFVDSFQRVFAVLPEGMELIVGETGWPTAGNTIGAAVPSGDNARRYFKQIFSWAEEEGVKILWFEATDESWKASHEGPQGAHWGIFDTGCVMKSDFNWVLY